jgi:hypothetical protein
VWAGAGVLAAVSTTVLVVHQRSLPETRGGEHSFPPQR